MDTGFKPLQKVSPSFAARKKAAKWSQNGARSVFGGGVYLGKNTALLASVHLVRAQQGAVFCRKNHWFFGKLKACVPWTQAFLYRLSLLRILALISGESTFEATRTGMDGRLQNFLHTWSKGSSA